MSPLAARETPVETWRRLTRAIASEPLPCAVVDLDAVEQNAAALNGVARAHGKTIRFASKSVRLCCLSSGAGRRAP